MPFPVSLRAVLLTVLPLSFAVAGQSDADLLPHPAEAPAFRARVTILTRSDDPEVALRTAAIPGVNFNVPTWRVEGESENWAAVRDEAQGGDGFDPSILDGDTRRRTPNLFRAGERVDLTACCAVPQADGSIELYFPEHPAVTVSATYRPAGPDGFPVLEIRAVRRQAVWLSIGYTGAPKVADADASEAWQPILWTERRFPNRPYLSPASLVTLPAALVVRDGVAYGALADPAELPYQPLPRFDNARFGIALRTDDAALQPMVFFPMLGGAGSRGEAGETLSFRIRLVAFPGDVTHAYETLARRVYGFADRRHNDLDTLNAALENVLDYAMSHYASWVEDLRGCGYNTDVPDSVKNVSSLNPLSLALVTDEPRYFTERAKPIIEYLWSREKFLFALDRNQRIQAPSRSMHGPSAPLSELAEWHRLSAGATDAFFVQAQALWGRNRMLNLDMPSMEANWWNALSLYLASGDRVWLERAVTMADEYLARRVDQPATSFADPDSIGPFFWPGFVPRWVDLLRLYEVTGEERYLAAAHRGARLSTLFLYVCPAVPEESIRVNEGGKAPLYWYLGSRGFAPIPVPEEEAPAWRLSEIGLGPESSGTAHGHRAIMMANYAPWYLRLSALTGDRFLHDLARWAVVGRWRNFPGYHINTARTTVYEKADYPLREHHELSYNSFHYNHIWPFASIVIDYLVSDAWARTKGAVDFPGGYIEGYAYMQSRLPGYIPGRVYDLDGVHLWMPRGLVATGSDELNYLSGYDESGLVVVLLNQSAVPVSTSVRLDPSRLAAAPVNGAAVRRWIDGIPAADAVWQDGVAVTVPAHGVAAVHVAGVRPALQFQNRLGGGPAIRGQEQQIGPGDARGTVFSLGPTLTWAYVYLREDDDHWQSVTLHVDRPGGSVAHTDDSYPFEFSIPLAPGEVSLPVRLEAVDRQGRVHRGERVMLGGLQQP